MNSSTAEMVLLLTRRRHNSQMAGHTTESVSRLAACKNRTNNLLPDHRSRGNYYVEDNRPKTLGKPNI